MIISQSRGFIFIHVPKNAGGSISKALEPFTTWRDIELGGTRSGERINQEYRARFGLHKHSTASEVRKAVGETFWKGAFKFAFRRDEESRRRSMYRYIKAKKNYHPDDLPETYEDFLKWGPFLKGLGPDRMFKPQDYWLDEPLDFTGHVETIHQDWEDICKRIGIPHVRLGRHNATQGTADTVAGPTT